MSACGMIVAMNSQGPEATAERLRVAFDLFAAGEQIMRQNLRRRFPNDDAGAIEARLDAWRCERPGAENGDAPGRTVGWPRRKP